jgi:hypothetical protein
MPIKTKLIGVTYENKDGTNRQKLLQEMHGGERIILAYEANNPKSDRAIAAYDTAKRKLGYLNDDLSADLVDQIKELGGAIYAKVSNITGGGRRHLGCAIEIPNVEELTEEEKEEIRAPMPTRTEGCILLAVIIAIIFAVLWFMFH